MGVGIAAVYKVNRQDNGTSDIRPARVHYLLALWGLKEPARQWTPVQSITKPVTHLASRARVGVYYSYLITIKLS